MARAKARVNIDGGKVRAMLSTTGGTAVGNAADATASRVQSNIRSLGRVDTGKMVGGIDAKVTRRGVISTAQVTSDQDYTIYQERGTRAHGPVTAPFLVFRIRGAGPLIFAKRVRGVTAGRFFERAIAALRVTDFR